jgi:hypothetical protein
MKAAEYGHGEALNNKSICETNAKTHKMQRYPDLKCSAHQAIACRKAASVGRGLSLYNRPDFFVNTGGIAACTQSHVPESFHHLVY